jgi:hypothetical protein
MALPVKIGSFTRGFRFQVSGVRKKTQKLKPEMWCLEFDILQCSITPADCRKRGKTIETPSAGSPKAVS